MRLKLLYQRMLGIAYWIDLFGRNVRLLFSRDPDLNIQGDSGKTVLMISTCFGKSRLFHFNSDLL